MCPCLPRSTLFPYTTLFRSFAEAWEDNTIFLGLQVPFPAAHRLHTAMLSDVENMRLYGKCNNPTGHGHRYLAETTIGEIGRASCRERVKSSVVDVSLKYRKR